MWDCPCCHENVEDEFDICWACGTSYDGLRDPHFLTADESPPIPDRHDEPAPEGDGWLEWNGLEDSWLDPPPAEFQEMRVHWSQLVACFEAENTVEAKFIADRLTEEGIPAMADPRDMNLVIGGLQPGLWGNGPKVRVRPEDLETARAWVNAFQRRRKENRGS